MEQRAEINRYVFHVTNSCNRESILKKGLLQSGGNHFNISNAVYAIEMGYSLSVICKLELPANY